MKHHTDTICAISTASGNGAIAVIRLSGPETFECLAKIFYPAQKPLSINKLEAYKIYYGQIKENNEVIDDVLVSIFRAPRSYTGEDSIEISCHGSVFIQQKILQILLNNGSRLASPGEFTQRAFLNGKMDLSQAEAVADLIASGNKAAHKLAMQQMRGEFSNSLNSLRSELLNISSLFELELDFSEEDVEFADRPQLTGLINKIIDSIEKLTRSFSYGNAVKSGVPVAIVGKTNVGKSTLLNALLRDDKAIVSNIAGTTRDAVEDTFVLEGIQFRFIDTAGLRKTEDIIENEGIKRTVKLASKSQIILYVLDVTDKDFNKDEIKIFLTDNNLPGKNLIIVLNKYDISGPIQNTVQELTKEYPESVICPISALNNQGVDILETHLVEHVKELLPENQDVVVTNLRHYEVLLQALEAAKRAKEGLETQIPTDLVANDIREITYYLGEITGEISTDDILGNIFRNFCIGK